MQTGKPARNTLVENMDVVRKRPCFFCIAHKRQATCWHILLSMHSLLQRSFIRALGPLVLSSFLGRIENYLVTFDMNRTPGAPTLRPLAQMKICWGEKPLGLSAENLGPCLGNHRNTLVSTVACVCRKALIGKAAKITFVEKMLSGKGLVFSAQLTNCKQHVGTLNSAYSAFSTCHSLEQ